VGRARNIDPETEAIPVQPRDEPESRSVKVNAGAGASQGPQPVYNPVLHPTGTEEGMPQGVRRTDEVDSQRGIGGEMLFPWQAHHARVQLGLVACRDVC
jgi:hypothetical protein